MIAVTIYMLITLVSAQKMSSIIPVIHTHRLLNQPEICQSRLFYLINIFHLDLNVLGR